MEDDSSGEFSQLWLNYRPIDVGENPNWEELIIVRDDTLFVAGEWVNHATKSTNPLGERQKLGIALMEYLGDERDNSLRSEMAKAWLEEHASHIYTDVEIRFPGVLIVTCPDSGRSTKRVGYHEPVDWDGQASLMQTRDFMLNNLARGGWVVVARMGATKFVSPKNVQAHKAIIQRIREGASDEEIKEAGTFIHRDWVKALREEVDHEDN